MGHAPQPSLCAWGGIELHPPGQNVSAGALSRDVLFVRIAPATFALSSVLHNLKRLGYEDLPAPASAPAPGGSTSMPGGSTPVPPSLATAGPSAAVMKVDPDGDMEMGGMLKQELGAAKTLGTALTGEPAADSKTPKVRQVPCAGF